MSDQILALDRVGTLESGSFTFTERVGFLKKYGTHSQSFSTLQPGMQYFDVPGMGYIAYMRKWGGTFVLSDPVCAPEDFANNAFHKIYNYPEHMQRLGLQVTDKKHFKLLNMNCYWSILGRKQA